MAKNRPRQPRAVRARQQRPHQQAAATTPTSEHVGVSGYRLAGAAAASAPAPAGQQPSDGLTTAPDTSRPGPPVTARGRPLTSCLRVTSFASSRLRLPTAAANRHEQRETKLAKCFAHRSFAGAAKGEEGTHIME